MAPPTRKVKGQKRPFGNASAKSTNKKLAVVDEEDFENSQDVEELQKLVLEAQRSRPKETKIKISKSSLNNNVGDDDEDEDDAENDEDDKEDDEDNLDEEARVLLEIQREREALENEEEVEGDEDDYKEEDFEQRAPPINDAPQMRQLANELTLPNFVEALAVVQELDEEEQGGGKRNKINPEDDKEREGLFQQIATRAVEQGREAMLKLNIPFYRPHDYMAEMIKSDDHMARVKRRILFEQEKIRAVEARKAAVRNRNRRKEVKKTRTGEKATQKRKASDLSQGFREKKKDFNGKDAKRGDRNERNAAKTKKFGGGGGGGASKGGNRLGKDKRKSSKGQGGRKH
ncbi:hypothetical protein BASA81_001743 [Batrachochytrium salamandrivorans]|nr:hypothetical protein BASA81_001743 [Batrachochytrium salamandrivorans]